MRRFSVYLIWFFFKTGNRSQNTIYAAIYHASLKDAIHHWKLQTLLVSFDFCYKIFTNPPFILSTSVTPVRGVSVFRGFAWELHAVSHDEFWIWISQRSCNSPTFYELFVSPLSLLVAPEEFQDWILLCFDDFSAISPACCNCWYPACVFIF